MGGPIIKLRNSMVMSLTECISYLDSYNTVNINFGVVQTLQLSTHLNKVIHCHGEQFIQKSYILGESIKNPP